MARSVVAAGGRERGVTLFQAMEAFRADYDAARETRFRRKRRGVTGTPTTGDHHYRTETDYFRMMETARDIDRNDLVTPQAIDRLTGHIVQQGFRLDPQTGDPGLDRELSDRWKPWSEDPEQVDKAGERSFKEMESAVFRATIVDGDSIALPLREGSIELLEAHRVRTPSNTRRNVVHGVLLDGNRRREEYWVTKEDVDPNRRIARVSDITAIPTRDAEGNRQVLHILFPRRISQTRGVTRLAPSINAISMIDDANFARLVQQQIVSCFAVFREREGGLTHGGSQPTGPETTQTVDGGTRTLQGIAPGMDVTGAPGEKLTGFSPNVPNPEYFDFVRMVLTTIAVNLDMPIQLLLLDATMTNFSGWRGSMDAARIRFRQLQQWLAMRFHRPVYLWKLRQWAVEDPLIASNANWKRHRWVAPTWPYMEPLKDATANAVRIRTAQISHTQLQAELGADWDEVSTQIVNDNAMAIKKAKAAALEINTDPLLDDENPVHWRELLNLPAPEGLTLSVGTEGGAADATESNGQG